MKSKNSLKLISFFCFGLLLFTSCTHSSSGSEEVINAKMQAAMDSMQAALTVQEDQPAVTIEGNEYIFFDYKLIPAETEMPGAVVTVYNHYSKAIASLDFIFSTSKTKRDDITSPATEISYLRYDAIINPGDTLRAKINFKAPKGWKKGDFGKLFLYKVTTIEGVSLTPELKLK
jgi:hypothetical protein